MIISKELRYIKISVAIFFLFSTLSFFAYSDDPEYFNILIKEFAAKFEFARDFNALQTFLMIFFNNSLIAYFIILLGFFFSLVPIFVLVSNASILGIVLAVAVNQIGWGPSLLALLPHGIIELPALFLASAYGIFLGNKFTKFIFRKEKFMPSFVHANKVYLKVILPLFFLAAIIETILIVFIK